MRKLIASFRFAFAGLAYLLRSQRNARLHLIAAILAVVAGFVLKIERTDWALVVVAIALVFAAERLRFEKQDLVLPLLRRSPRFLHLGSQGVLSVSLLSELDLTKKFTFDVVSFRLRVQ